MNAHTSLWTLLLHPQGTDLLPFAKSNTWSAQSQSLLEWTRLTECKDRVRSPGSLWTILHQTSVPSGATWADFIAEHTLEDLLNALRKGEERNRGPRLCFMEHQMAHRPPFRTKHPQAPAHQEVAGRGENHLLIGDSLGNLRPCSMGEPFPCGYHHCFGGRQRSRRCRDPRPSVS